MSVVEPVLAGGVPVRDPARCSWRALGTTVDLVVTDATALPQACELLEFELGRIDALASRFRLDSEITRVNQAGGHDTAVSPGLAEALEVALRAAELTGGLVDPTVGDALIRAGYDRDFAQVPPDGPPIFLDAVPAPGWRQVALDTRRGRVRTPPGTRIDLGATAKALSADRAADTIARATGTGAAVSLGGDVAVAGPVPDGGWVVQITEDLGSRQVAGPCVTIVGGGVATSGTTVRQWRRGDTALHHIIDPATGLPALSCWRTVSVAAGSCVDANIAATAGVLLGAAAPAWLRERKLPARLVDVKGDVTVVGGWPEDPAPPAGPTRRTGRSSRRNAGALRHAGALRPDALRHAGALRPDALRHAGALRPVK